MAPPPPGPNGVLPVSATAIQKATPNTSGPPRGPSHKAPSPRLKVQIRRLPPGLKQNEFEAALGDGWRLGGKPSRPSSVYLHLTAEAHVAPFDTKFREITFVDAANSSQDAALVGPPELIFAPLQKIPGGRRRNDARQGTIDTDPDFMKMLEELTNPTPKPSVAEGEADAAAAKEERPTTTPLIEALREKKAEKKAAKEKGPAVKVVPKHGRGESKDDADQDTGKKGSRRSGKEAAASLEKGKRLSRAEKAAIAKDAVKVLNKGASGPASPKPSTATPASQASTAGQTSPPSSRGPRRRGDASIAAKMLQRDLGLAPSPGRRGAKRETAAAASASTATAPSAQTAETPKAETAPTKAVQSEPATVEKPAPAANTNRGSRKDRDHRQSRAERRANKAAAQAEKPSGQEPAATQTASARPPTGPSPKILKKPNQPNTPLSPPKGPAANRPQVAKPVPAAATNTTVATTAAPTSVSSPPLVPATSASPTPSNASLASTPSTAPAPTGPARKAFLKHANASQGITEPLLHTALSAYGEVENVEIDKRKGFAYVTYKATEGLQEAIKNSPVKVAQGAVEVHGCREKNGARRGPGPMRGRGGFAGRGRGRGRGSHAGSGGASPAPAAPAPAAAPT